MGLWRLSALAVGIVVAGLVSAGVARADVFTAVGIPVDASAVSATEAREVAHQQGRRAAFEEVLRRLTREDDWPSLPMVSDADLMRISAGLSITEERNSRNRYLATIGYSFMPEGVREALQEAGIAFSESQARTAVVLPVLDYGSQRLLWEQPNPWMTAWQAKRLTHELTPILAPLGDLEDIAAVDADRALSARWPDLQRLSDRYEGADVLVAKGRVRANGNEGLMTVTVLRVTANGESEPMTVRARGPLTPPEGAQGDAAKTVFDRAVAETVAALSRDWKAMTLVDYEALNRLDATVRFASLEDWADMRRAIEGQATVIEWRTTAMSASGAELDVVFAGSVDQLALNLEQRGFALSGEEGYWQVARRGFQAPRLEDAFGQRPPVMPYDPNAPAEWDVDPFAPTGSVPGFGAPEYDALGNRIPPYGATGATGMVPSGYGVSGQQPAVEDQDTPPLWPSERPSRYRFGETPPALEDEEEDPEQDPRFRDWDH